ncbi:MAG TPA: DUF523 and DUF1722 domain-containing protein, partial [Phycisphaerae bacterium]|nr:DUF523 and DUF1722 domain-containing protein [Phycisphaerae bacterium]
MTEHADRPIRIGISSCLLGQKVRFDGGHKHDRYLTDTLGQYFEWVPVCPEVEIGLGIPRPTIRLQRHGADVRLVMPKEDRDLTAAMRKYAKRRVAELAGEDLSGYILKKSSPSCGMERVRIYPPAGATPEKDGRGMFAEALLERFPNLPVEEEGRLCDPRLRENWIARVFAYHRLRSLFSRRWKLGEVVAFHTVHKLVLMAHRPAAYQELGRLVARAKQVPRAELHQQYEDRFMAALTHRATTARNTNVLLHMLGYFKKTLDADCRHELLGVIEDYRGGLVPLVVPITLMKHYVR